MKLYGITHLEKSRLFLFKLILSLIILLVLFSCSKNKGHLTNDEVSIQILVSGIELAEEMSGAKAAIGNQIGLSIEGKRNLFSVSNEDVFYDIISDETLLISDYNKDILVNDKSRALGTQPMAKGVRFRLLLYNANTGDFYVSLEAKVGESSHISVVPGQEYKWIAYSYNTDQSLPHPSNLEDPHITTPINNSLLYNSGTISTSVDGTALPIVFKHQLTQLKVELKEGIRGVLKAAGHFSSSNYIKTCRFNLLNGNRSDLVSADISNLDFKPVMLGDTLMQIAYYYTADDHLTSYEVDITSVDIQYTSKDQRTLSANQLPSSGHLSFNFPQNPASKKGYVLKGSLALSFLIPKMFIQTFSNADESNGYRIPEGKQVYNFLMDPQNFGTTSTSYVKSKGFYITPPTTANLATTSTTGHNRFNALLSDPANYPDILVFANWHNYATYEGHVLLNNYLEAGGAVFYTHDDASLENSNYAGPGLALILDDPGVKLQKHAESYSVYRFTDTQEGANDAIVLDGPFGNVKNYYWGEDRVGTSYLTGITNPNVIVYTRQPVNHAQNSFVNQGSLLRHKTKNFFFAGDGGFYLGENSTSNLRAPFRTNTNNFPILSNYGSAYGSLPAGSWQIANSFIFGNVIANFINRIHYHGIKGKTRVTP